MSECPIHIHILIPRRSPAIQPNTHAQYLQNIQLMACAGIYVSKRINFCKSHTYKHKFYYVWVRLPFIILSVCVLDSLSVILNAYILFAYKLPTAPENSLKKLLHKHTITLTLRHTYIQR